jgi:predicted S18 family serine protease
VCMGFHFFLPRRFSIPLVCIVLGLIGCSSARPPDTAMAQAKLAVEQASNSKASVYDQADLQRAREKLSNAERSVTDKKYDAAQYLAEQATVDAQLAEARANASEAMQNEVEVRKTVDALRNEATQSTTNADEAMPHSPSSGNRD